MHSLALIENVFFLLLIAAVGLIRWLVQASEAKKNADAQKRAQSSSPNAPAPRAETQSEEERVRRFMDALGVPTSNVPPKRIPPHTIVPKTPPRVLPRKFRPLDPFPRPRTGPWSPEPLPVAPAIPELTPVVSSPPALAIQKSSAPSFEVRAIDGVAEESNRTALVRQASSAVAQTWAARLSTAASLRDAIVLREIFGAPRSLQPLDLHSLG